MTEGQWLGNEIWDAVVVKDPLFHPNFAHWLVVPQCDCNPMALHSDNCPWTPIYAQLRTEMDLPTPWDWPMGAVYLELRPDILGFDWESVIGRVATIEHVPVYPGWAMEASNDWTLPDYSFGGDDEPPWITRQENPDR